MKTVGVIAEYNPFHRGHAFHLEQARKLSGADFVIVAMSGNFVQRGAPAMFDKYTRAEAALRNGADLVLELPPCVSTASAEYFASGAVSLLLHTGIVTDLCFGSECGDLKPLEGLAAVLTEEPREYRGALQEYLSLGCSYPKACAMALGKYDRSISGDILRGPNNLLGVEYLKALKRAGSTLSCHTVPRAGASYHGKKLSHAHPASAGAVRRALLQNGGLFTGKIVRELPSHELYTPYMGKPPLTEDCFSLLLLGKLRQLQAQGTPPGRYFGVTEDLSNRIQNLLDDFSSFSQFADLLKSRNHTRTFVSRALLHILLDIREYKSPALLRVLGFRGQVSVLLRQMQERGSLPVVTNLSKTGLPPDWLYADRLYGSVRSLRHGHPYKDELRRKMLVVGS